MKKRTIAVYALLGALSASPVLTSCIDDNESASVTELRNAKAQQLKAQAEAELIRAKANASLQEAQAELERAKADYQKALKEGQDIENDAAKERYATELEVIKVKAQAEILKAQKEIMELKNQMEDAALERYNQLFKQYMNMMEDMLDLKLSLIESNTELAKLEANMTTETCIAKTKILKSERKIAKLEAMLEVLKDPKYQSLDNKELKVQLEKGRAQLEMDAIEFVNSKIYTEYKSALHTFNQYYDKYSSVLTMVEELNRQAVEMGIPQPIIKKFVKLHYLDYIFMTTESQPNQQFAVPNFFTDLIIYGFSVNEEFAIRFNEELEKDVENLKASLGTPEDDMTKKTAYGNLAAAKAAMDEAKALPETTPEEIKAKEKAIEEANILIIRANNELELAIANVKAVEEINQYARQKLEEAKKLLDISDQYIAAIEKYELAKVPYTEKALELVQREDELDALESLIDEKTIDIELEIARLEKKIAEEKAQITNLQATLDGKGNLIALIKETIKQGEKEIANFEKMIEVLRGKIAEAINNVQ